MGFTIKTSNFEGPLDLLLELIEKKKLFIGDIALSRVTDDFIAHIQQYENMPMGESAHFILIASTLLLIKSKSLLPDLALTEEEQGDIHDLETRLKIYKRIKEASTHVATLFGGNVIFFQSQLRPVAPVFVPVPEFTITKAVETLRDLIKRLPKKETLPEITVKKVISLEEMINTLATRIQGAIKISFNEFTATHRAEKVNVIVSFLAMLELVKQGIVHVNQESSFGDIQIETNKISTPRY
ncbi:MAG: segregation/condensation protein A [Patescibacteria group bacterium]|nr:segregation/condensation protein A [Patescibacteria group bacterium]